MKCILIVCAAALCGLALACSESELVNPDVGSDDATALGKGKPGSEPAPPGTIYAYINGVTFTIDGDGRNRHDLGPAIGGDPSHLLHGGTRWFAGWDFVGTGCSPYDPVGYPNCYPDSTSMREIVVTDSLDNELGRLSDPLLDVDDVRWLPDDEGISFYGRRFPDASSAASEGGIYTVSVDANGAPDPATLTLVLPTTSWSTGSCTASGICQRYPRRGRGGHDWSPAGDRLVFSVCGDTLAVGDSTFVFDTYTGSVQPFVPWGIEPRWSTNDRLLLLDSDYLCTGIRNAKLYTLNSDGSNVTLIERLVHKPKAIGYISYIANGTWSPTGDHVAYFLYQCGGNPQCSKEVVRRRADGSDRKVLVSESYGLFGGGVLGWR